LRLPYCDFVVWTPAKTQIRRYEFDMEYWQTVLYPRLHRFYMQEYLPRLILQQEGVLKQGDLEPSVHLEEIRPEDQQDRPDFDFVWSDPLVTASSNENHTSQEVQTPENAGQETCDVSAAAAVDQPATPVKSRKRKETTKTAASSTSVGTSGLKRKRQKVSEKLEQEP
jgi:hypothetical protein